MKAKPAGADASQMWAWAVYDWAHNAFGTIVLTFVFSTYFTRQIAPDPETGTTLWGTAVAVSALIVAVAAPVLGAIADQKGSLKPWLGGFTLATAIATAALWFATPGQGSITFSLILLGIGILASQLAQVFYNSLLPHLVGPEARRKWSGWGWGLGYLGGLACLVVIWLVFVGSDALWELSAQDGLGVRAALLFTAAWLVVFALPLMIVTPDAPGRDKKLGHAVADGLEQLRQSLMAVWRGKTMLRFLIAHMLYIDALAAVFAMGGVFAGGAMGMSTQEVLLFGISLNVTAGLGALGFAWVDAYLGSKTTILIALAGLIVSAAGMLIAADTVSVFWGFGMAFGVFVGPVQAASRSFMAEAAPPALRSQLFGLFALSGKATSFIGPLLVGLVTWWTDSPRIGMSVLLPLFVAGFLLLLTVPPAERISVQR